MSDHLMLGAHARWKVCWIAYKDRKVNLKKGGTAIRKVPVVVEKEFGHDLNSALALYQKALRAEKKMATLLCTNVAFPPPEKYLPRKVKKVKKEKVRRRVDGKMKTVLVKRRVEVEVDPMQAVNAKGWIWCPYCREFRKFRVQDGFRSEGQYVNEKGHHCPICEISQRNVYVRRYNPRMAIEYFKLQQPRRVVKGKPNGRRSRTNR